MRDTYVLILFSMFIASGTFLAYSGKVEPQLILTPIVTGFLGLLASTRPHQHPLPPGPYLETTATTRVATLAQRIGISKPPPAEEKDKQP
jgi:hypothetical protein